MNAENEADQHFGAGALEHFSWKDTLDLYSARSADLPDALPGLQHRQAAVTQDADHRSARPRVREPCRGLRGDEARRARRSGRRRRREYDSAVMWTSGDHHPGAMHDLPGHFQPSWLSPDDVAAAVPNGGPRPLIGGTILEETLWSCTTCGACMDQCPVLIEHVPKDHGHAQASRPR